MFVWIRVSGGGASSDFTAFFTAPVLGRPVVSAARSGPESNSVAFSKPPAQIGHACAGSDHLCIVVGPATERDRLGACFGSAGREGRNVACRQIALAANG